jgi:Ca2+-binding EF-hand superfamily protein
MIKLLLAGATATAVAIVPAVAQPAPPPPPGVASGAGPVASVPGVPRVVVQTRMHGMDMPETRAEVIAHVRDMFAKLDANRDGFVTREESDAAHPRMHGAMAEHKERHFEGAAMPHMDSNAMFDQLDTNKDGMISRQEFAAHAQIREERHMVMMHGGRDGAPGMPPMPDMKGMHEMGMRVHNRLFDMADANHDGRVSLQEMTDAALKHFDMADANHDGKITPDERTQMHQHLRMLKRPA